MPITRDTLRRLQAEAAWLETELRPAALRVERADDEASAVVLARAERFFVVAVPMLLEHASASLPPSSRADGYYWIRIDGGPPIVSRFEAAADQWLIAGSDRSIGAFEEIERGVVVVSDRLEPAPSNAPQTPPLPPVGATR